MKKRRRGEKEKGRKGEKNTLVIENV